jgi:hypothetical protein
VAGGAVTIVAGCVAVARSGEGTQRALSPAAATGALFGVTAGLTKVAANDLHHGVGECCGIGPATRPCAARPPVSAAQPSADGGGIAVLGKRAPAAVRAQ